MKKKRKGEIYKKMGERRKEKEERARKDEREIVRSVKEEKEGNNIYSLFN